MAEVFAGHAIGDHGFQKPVAIKRLLPELANDTVFVERLIGEAKLLVGMQHGNIVSVLDLARDGDDVFLVMEFVDGPSLRQLLKGRGSRGLPLGVASYIVQSAAAGLEFAHVRPGGAIIHADISPSNLLLTTSGEVRVADFGIARREGGAHGVVEGKWAYMAPEQARGEPLTPRSDVFALGVVLYELITGSHPFGRQITEHERDGEQMRVIPPRIVRPTVPAGLDAICMRALAHDPRERYGRMQHMIDAILDERFANQWREGASDLASAIREIAPPVPGVQAPRTMVTDRPVTIVTRSLIELTPARRSSQKLARPAHTPPPVVIDEPPHIEVPAAMYEIPPALRAEGAPMPAFRLSSAVMPGHDLASVHGGTMVTAASHLGAVAAAPRSNRWAFTVLAAAAVLGAIAAVVLQLGPNKIKSAEAEPVQVAQQQQAPSADLADAVGTPAPAPVTTVTAQPIEPAVEPAVEPTVAAAPAVTEPSVFPAETTPAPVAPVEPRPQARSSERSRPAAPAKKKEPGLLRVTAWPWAWVQVDGGARQNAPGAKFSLQPGKYRVKIYNDEGAMKTRTVTIESNKVKILKVNWEEETFQEINQ